jgi:hypothetical protein
LPVDLVDGCLDGQVDNGFVRGKVDSFDWVDWFDDEFVEEQIDLLDGCLDRYVHWLGRVRLI